MFGGSPGGAERVSVRRGVSAEGLPGAGSGQDTPNTHTCPCSIPTRTHELGCRGLHEGLAGM